MGFLTLPHPRPSTAVLKLQQARNWLRIFPWNSREHPGKGNIFRCWTGYNSPGWTNPRGSCSAHGTAAVWAPCWWILSLQPHPGHLRGSRGSRDRDGQGMSHLEMLIPTEPTQLLLRPLCGSLPAPAGIPHLEFWCGLTNLLIFFPLPFHPEIHCRWINRLSWEFLHHQTSWDVPPPRVQQLRNTQDKKLLTHKGKILWG